MAYPFDYPSESMSTVWNSGQYTPEDVVVYIRDNYTPINKTAMRNSLGYQVSLVQNYVNSHYLGRDTLPIDSGFINYAYIGSGLSSLFHCPSIPNQIGYGASLTNTSLIFNDPGPGASYTNTNMIIDNNASSSDWKFSQITDDYLRIAHTVNPVGPGLIYDSTLNSSGLHIIEEDSSILTSSGLYTSSGILYDGVSDITIKCKTHNKPIYFEKIVSDYGQFNSGVIVTSNVNNQKTVITELVYKTENVNPMGQIIVNDSTQEISDAVALAIRNGKLISLVGQITGVPGAGNVETKPIVRASGVNTGSLNSKIYCNYDGSFTNSPTLWYLNLMISYWI
jgi:hypothetical protein